MNGGFMSAEITSACRAQEAQPYGSSAQDRGSLGTLSWQRVAKIAHLLRVLVLRVLGADMVELAKMSGRLLPTVSGSHLDRRQPSLMILATARASRPACWRAIQRP